MEDGILVPSQMDGGFEVNGYYLYQEGYEPVMDGSKSWWWVMDDLYVVAFGQLPGYRLERRADFGRWLPPGTGEVLLLKRAGAGTETAASAND